MNRSRSALPGLAAGAVALATCISPAKSFATAILTGDATAFVDPSGQNSLSVGGSTAGGTATFTPSQPNTFNNIAVGQGGDGGISVSGAGATLDAANRISIGTTTSGSLTIDNGGIVNANGGPNPFTSAAGASSTIVGLAAGATGTVTVTGAGSQFNVSNANPGAILVVGNGFVGPGLGTPGASTSGTVNVLNGASMSTPGATIGNLSLTTGTVNVDGAGSLWTINPSGPTQGAFLNLGVNGTGNLNVTNGASVTGARLAVIGGNAGGIGNLTIDSNSSVNMTGAFGGFGPVMLIGETDGATGTVTVKNGGRLIVDGTGIPGAGAPGIIVGGSGAIDVVGTGNGTLNIQGAGSQVVIKGDQEHTGSIVSNTGLTVGQSGTGVMNITQGGTLTIQDTSAAALGGMSIGGNILQAQLGQVSGTGSVLVSDPGSRIDVTAVNAGMAIGNNGPGMLTVANGAAVQITGGASVGRNPGSTGSLTVTGLGSTFAATGNLGIGTNGGSGVVSLHCGGSISAANISIGANATAGGCGTITGNVISNGTLQVGASPDQLRINGNYSQTGGTIKFEIDPDGRGGFVTSSLVLKPKSTFGVNGAKIVFSFLNGADPLAFAHSGAFDLDTFFRIDDPNAADGTDPLSSLLSNGQLLDALFAGAMAYDVFADSFDVTSFAFNTDSGVSQLTETPLPEPGSLLTFASGLAGLLMWRRRATRHVGLGQARKESLL